MHLWEVWRPLALKRDLIVTKEKEISEVDKVLKENDLKEVKTIKYVEKVKC